MADRANHRLLLVRDGFGVSYHMVAGPPSTTLPSRRRPWSSFHQTAGSVPRAQPYLSRILGLYIHPATGLTKEVILLYSVIYMLRPILTKHHDLEIDTSNLSLPTVPSSTYSPPLPSYFRRSMCQYIKVIIIDTPFTTQT